MLLTIDRPKLRKLKGYQKLKHLFQQIIDFLMNKFTKKCLSAFFQSCTKNLPNIY